MSDLPKQIKLTPNTPVEDRDEVCLHTLTATCKCVLGVSSYNFKWWLKQHPIRSSRGVDIQTPQTAVLKHPIFNSVHSQLKTGSYTSHHDEWIEWIQVLFYPSRHIPDIVLRKPNNRIY